MTFNEPHKRPNCEKILNGKSLWALDKEVFEIDEKLRRELILKLDDENQIVNSILKSKLYELEKFLDFEYKMEIKLNTNKVLFNKLNVYFKHNIRMSLICRGILIIVTKEDLFYCINIENENIPSFIINNDNSVIEEMIVQALCHKQINDIKISHLSSYCFARNVNEYNIYCYDIEYGVMKE